MTIMNEMILIPAIVVVVLIVLGITFWARYKTVSTDEAMVVTGSFLGSKNISDDGAGRKIKIVRGGGAFIWPIFQKSEFLSLLSHKLDVTTPEVYTEQGVPVLADGVAIIKIGSSVEDVATAAEQFMGKPIQALQGEAQEVLEGHLRSIIATVTALRRKCRVLPPVILKRWVCRSFPLRSRISATSMVIWNPSVNRELQP